MERNQLGDIEMPRDRIDTPKTRQSESPVENVMSITSDIFSILEDIEKTLDVVLQQIPEKAATDGNGGSPLIDKLQRIRGYSRSILSRINL